jgi:hypothetical protein
MGTYGALAHTMWMGGYDLGADLTQMGLTVTFEPLKDTRFGMTAQSRRGGLQDVQASANGFHQAGDDLVDAELWAQFSETMQPVTQTPTGTVGDVAYFYQARKFTQSLFGNVGERAPFTIGPVSAGRGRGRPARTAAGCWCRRATCPVPVAPGPWCSSARSPPTSTSTPRCTCSAPGRR